MTEVWVLAAHVLIRRLRTLTFGLLTPLYFIRAGSFVSVPALIGSAVIPTIIANAFYLPKHLLELHEKVEENEKGII